MCFIERETTNFILKFRGIFLWRETVLRAYGMKSDEKSFFFQIYVIVLFLEGLKIFLNLRLSLIVPLYGTSATHIFAWLHT